MDVINLLNLLNNEWGWQYFPLFPSSSANGLIGYGGIDPVTGKERLNLSTSRIANVPGHLPARRPAVAVAGAVGRQGAVLKNLQFTIHNLQSVSAGGAL
jgi:hypothetical protein